MVYPFRSNTFGLLGFVESIRPRDHGSEVEKLNLVSSNKCEIGDKYERYYQRPERVSLQEIQRESRGGRHEAWGGADAGDGYVDNPDSHQASAETSRPGAFQLGKGHGESQCGCRPDSLRGIGVIFLDSSLIVAYLNEADENHQKAMQVVRDLAEEKYGSAVISDYIFDEVVTVMLVKSKNLVRVVRLGEKLLSATQLIKIDEDLFNSGWKIFKQQRKTMLSFTDCTSIAVCRLNGISNVATFDEDFGKIEDFNKIGI